MLSVKQSVVVQDCSRTRNNNKLKRRQRSGCKQQKIDQKVKCWHKISREEPFQAARRSFTSRETVFRPREKVSQAAWEIFTSRLKLGTICLILREEVQQTAWNSDKIVPTEEISREIEMISRETGMISRETKRFRAKVQTSLQTANSDWFRDF